MCNIILDTNSIYSLNEALSSPWPNRIVSVSKQITKRTVHGVNVEQSDLRVSRQQSSLYTDWRTICFESNSLHKLDGLLQCEVKALRIGIQDYLRAIPNSVVQGYPAFILEYNPDGNSNYGGADTESRGVACNS